MASEVQGYSRETEESLAWWKTVKAKHGLKNKKVFILAVWELADGSLAVRVGPRRIVKLPAGTDLSEWFPPVSKVKLEEAAQQQLGGPAGYGEPSVPTPKKAKAKAVRA